MECFFILCFTPRNTEAVFKVVNGFFHVSTDFIGGIPFFCATDCSRVSAEILFWINVDHPPAGRSSTRIVTVADTIGFFRFFIILPFHFGADKLHGRNTAAQMRFTTFPFHWQGRIVRATGDAIFVYRIVNPFKLEFVF